MVTYIAKTPLFVCPPGTEDRRHYAPGDLIHDFASWPDYARRSLIDAGQVAPCKDAQAPAFDDLSGLGALLSANADSDLTVAEVVAMLAAARKNPAAPHKQPESAPQPQTVDPTLLPEDLPDDLPEAPDGQTPAAEVPKRRGRPRKHPQQDQP